MGKMTVYHGSYTVVKKPKVAKGKNTKDFGTGLKILEFKDMTEEWLDFIIDCRHGKTHDYDIVIGAMANDQIYNFIADYMDGIITREQFWALARFKYPTHQINFCTPEALNCLEFISSEEL